MQLVHLCHLRLLLCLLVLPVHDLWAPHLGLHVCVAALPLVVLALGAACWA